MKFENTIICSEIVCRSECCSFQIILNNIDRVIARPKPI